MAELSRRLSKGLKAFPKSAWTVRIVVGERGEDHLKPELHLELSVAGHEFRAIIRGQYDIKLKIDGITVGGQWYAARMTLLDRLFNRQSQLGHYLRKLFSADIDAAVRLQRAKDDLACRELVTAHENKQRRQEELDSEKIRDAEQALDRFFHISA